MRTVRQIVSIDMYDCLYLFLMLLYLFVAVGVETAESEWERDDEDDIDWINWIPIGTSGSVEQLSEGARIRTGTTFGIDLY